jgi:MtrB/PioB family decaheme-associated outer membrane protein
MRVSRFVSILALTLVPATVAAQTPAAPAAPQAAESTTPWNGTVDFGVRGTATTGDAARYERYRDMGNGLFLETGRAGRLHNNVLYNIGAEHVGREDQRYTGSVVQPGRLKLAGMYDQIPMLMSTTTVTLFTGLDTDVLALDDNIQRTVQANNAALQGILNQQGVTFDLKTMRKIGEGKVQFLANDELTVNGLFRQTNKSGMIPYGGSFGHSAVTETPMPTNQSLTDLEANAEWSRNALTLRGGYTGSWFGNDFETLAFDNPFIATDTTSSSSRGRLSLQPGNSFITVNGFASIKLPHRSLASAYVSTGSLKDAGDPIMPQTINTATSPAPIARSTVDGEARTSSVNLTFVSRPTSTYDINVRYKLYDYDNKRPEFPMTQRVAYDNSPSNISPAIISQPFGLQRSAFDADLRYFMKNGMSSSVGYSHNGEERTHRIFESAGDNVLRLTFDKVTTQWFTLRSKYEYAHRRGSEFDDETLHEAGEQPGMRHFDMASRDRNRITVLGTVMPRDVVSFNGSLAIGKDDYLESEFGVRDNNHWIYSAGVDYMPNDLWLFSTSYSYERYYTLSRSRQAGDDIQFNDPSRNWATDANDRTHSWMTAIDINKIADKVNLRLSYDFSHNRGTYEYITGAVVDRTLPDEVVLPSTLPPPSQLPPTLSQLGRGTVDVIYPVSPRLSFGVSWWHERYEVSDFTLDEDSTPNLARGQTLLLGYLYKPYTADTIWGRLIYAW